MNKMVISVIMVGVMLVGCASTELVRVDGIEADAPACSKATGDIKYLDKVEYKVVNAGVVQRVSNRLAKQLGIGPEHVIEYKVVKVDNGVEVEEFRVQRLKDNVIETRAFFKD